MRRCGTALVIPSERSESRDLHVPSARHRRNADNNTDFAETAGSLRVAERSLHRTIKDFGTVDAEKRCARVWNSTRRGVDPALSAESPFKIRVP